MFPEIDPISDSDTLPVQTDLGKVFLFDFEEKRYVLRDGKPVEASYDEAIRQWVTMLLITEIDQYFIYADTEFGIGIKQFIGRRDIPLGVINSEVKRQITEQVTKHSQITGVDNFEIAREDGKAKLTFSVSTLRGVVDGIESEVKIGGRDF
ncbi:DUF2634 domain-containing protein [Paenibacillus chibensis]|uniref:DUF2634 domain-containing protein n=1 Tax=Paenibacillus chibensis TaxID=59846 RepID=A0ABU6PUA5_9BACL|nr:DUF2634 domain-containing protein [Paenibacillus chibensis]